MGNETKIWEGVGKRRVKARYESVEDDSVDGDAEVSRDALSEEKTEKQDQGLERHQYASDHHGADAIRSKVNENMDELRVLARHEYLGRREKEKFVLLIRELEILEDDIKKYGWDNLSERERSEIILKRELVQLINSKRSIEDTNYYTLAHDDADNSSSPTDKKRKTLYGNEYDGSKRQRNPGEIWEDNQIRNAVKTDAGHQIDNIQVKGSEKYDYVFDEEAMIDFTSDQEDMLDDENDEDTSSGEEDAELENLREKLNMEENRIVAIQESRKLLPVYKYRQSLLDAIKENQVLIVVGETGSGKTTQLPQYLIEENYTQNGKFQIAVTQPRRVAATSVASRVADEMNAVLGQEVGYTIRFDDKTTPNKTLLKYMTDGMLLREFLNDPMLSRYSCIMIDEAHERTLATDILLGLLKNILLHRTDLKLIISSATMNSTKFSNFFNKCPIFNVPGRRYPVDIHYTVQPEANYMNAAITTIFQIHTTQALPGDILVFLTGQEEIENVRENLEAIIAKLGSSIPQMLITPIYANLPQEQQDRIFQKTPNGCRKVVLATNIAETSLTIDGIKYVIDPGYVKENAYVPSTGMSQLLTVPCSKASVDQRAGRAGRVGPGKCFRLFTKWSYYNELEMMPKPEILRTNISNIVLLLLSLGVSDLIGFPLLDKPSIQSLSKALETLYILGALNSNGSITRLGRIMCEFPCEPEFAKVIYTSATNETTKGVLEECVTIVAMLQEVSSMFIGSSKEAMNRVVGDSNSDHLLYLKIYDQWSESDYSKFWCKDHKVQYKTLCRVRNIREQLWKCSERLGLVALNIKARQEIPDITNMNITSKISKCFITGFPMNIAKLGTTGYRTIGKGKANNGLEVLIHPSSVVYQKSHMEEGRKPTKHILFQQLMLTTKEYARVILPIANESWLNEMVPQLYKKLER
ncbi:hypothetical protein TPHA_0D03700 [Tetrapisispora phaffii CBS 4417]|uniref:RNA helicase n=1 Tax=Tetrapisispora phaffii (strain ATCC 24235 / CBS 4417 / NBRC 1672 / NRRL Y-8282 / UCD 70-5) TaxID=1071381 RepID=G8BT34_TETPH|nr:hypothetical protein TPHA_0D03700 [Tetrapisispora phaffii CBS 4417]CCE63005.1 hypothetical protein TPHA_0D03700 [Tetrapisispora phaffii CBS 4417]